MTGRRTVTVEVPDGMAMAVVVTDRGVMMVAVSNIELRSSPPERGILGERYFSRTTNDVDFWFKLEGRPVEIVSIDEANSIGVARLPEKR